MARKIYKGHFRRHFSRLRDLRHQGQRIKRSRERKARLLGIARRKGFTLVAKRLRRPGMTVLDAGIGDSIGRQDRRKMRDGLRPVSICKRPTQYWLYIGHDPNLTPEAKNHVRLNRIAVHDQIRADRLDMRQRFADNIRAMKEGGVSVSMRKEKATFTWVLPEVYLDGRDGNEKKDRHVLIGDLKVVLSLFFGTGSWGAKVSNTTFTNMRSGFPHPHVNTSGAICWGNYHPMAHAFMKSGDLLAAKDVIDNLLQTYNTNSPYIQLREWEVKMVRCGECDELTGERDLIRSTHYEGRLCHNCVRHCEHCGEYVLRQDFIKNGVCQACWDRDGVTCVDCKRDYWEKNCHPTNKEGEYICNVCSINRRRRAEKKAKADRLREMATKRQKAADIWWGDPGPSGTVAIEESVESEPDEGVAGGVTFTITTNSINQDIPF